MCCAFSPSSPKMIPWWKSFLNGSFCGTIGGGCGEAEVWQAAMDTMRDGEPRLVTVDLTEDVDGPDKICGGIMNIFVERLSPE